MSWIVKEEKWQKAQNGQKQSVTWGLGPCPGTENCRRGGIRTSRYRIAEVASIILTIFYNTSQGPRGDLFSDKTFS